VRVNSLSNLQTTPFDTETLTIGANMRLSDRISNSVRANYSTQSSKADQTLDSFGGAMPLSANLLLSPLAPSSNQAAFELADANDFFLGPNSRNRTRQFNGVDDVVGRTVPTSGNLVLIIGPCFGFFARSRPDCFSHQTPQQFLATEGSGSEDHGF
jgi:hypothetical protein